MKLIDADKLLEWIQRTSNGRMPYFAYGEGVKVALRRTKNKSSRESLLLTFDRAIL